MQVFRQKLPEIKRENINLLFLIPMKPSRLFKIKLMSSLYRSLLWLQLQTFEIQQTLGSFMQYRVILIMCRSCQQLGLQAPALARGSRHPFQQSVALQAYFFLRLIKLRVVFVPFCARKMMPRISKLLRREYLSWHPLCCEILSFYGFQYKKIIVFQPTKAHFGLGFE